MTYMSRVVAPAKDKKAGGIRVQLLGYLREALGSRIVGISLALGDLETTLKETQLQSLIIGLAGKVLS